MNTKKAKKILSERGMALVELAITLPIITIFLFAGTEFSRSFRTRQIAAALSKELANDVLRECAGIQTNSALQTCLNQYQDSIKAIGQVLVPNTVVYVSIMKMNGASATRTSSSDYTTAGTFPSKYSVSGNTIVGMDDPNLIQTTRINVIAEAYVPYTAIFTNIMGAQGSFQFNPTSYYESTIM